MKSFILANIIAIDVDQNGMVDYVCDGRTNASFQRSAIKGDINQDGVIDLIDAVITLKVVAVLNPGQNIYIAADVNDDGKLGIEEAISVLEKILEFRD